MLCFFCQSWCTKSKTYRQIIWKSLRNYNSLCFIYLYLVTCSFQYESCCLPILRGIHLFKCQENISHVKTIELNAKDNCCTYCKPRMFIILYSFLLKFCVKSPIVLRTWAIRGLFQQCASCFETPLSLWTWIFRLISSPCENYLVRYKINLCNKFWFCHFCSSPP